MSAPRISILLPVWNAAGTISLALESIRRQTEPAWECVAVDDGSHDGTAGVLKAAAAADPRVRVVTIPHRGLVAALNEGLSHCTAPLIARMDADDVMHRERLARQAGALDDDPGLAAVGAHVRLFPRRGLSERRREYERWLNSLCTGADLQRDRFVECPIAHPTLMMRDSLADLRYEDRGWPEDYDLMLRAYARGLRLGVVAARLLSWQDRPSRASRTDTRYSIEQFTACKAHYLAQSFLADSDAFVLWGYGSTGRLLRRALLAHGKRPRAIVEVKPGRLGQRIHGAPVIPIASLAALRGEPIVVSVARAGPRAEIRAALASMAFIEGRDFVCAA